MYVLCFTVYLMVYMSRNIDGRIRGGGGCNPSEMFLISLTSVTIHLPRIFKRWTIWVPTITCGLRQLSKGGVQFKFRKITWCTLQIHTLYIPTTPPCNTVEKLKSFAINQAHYIFTIHDHLHGKSGSSLNTCRPFFGVGGGDIDAPMRYVSVLCDVAWGHHFDETTQGPRERGRRCESIIVLGHLGPLCVPLSEGSRPRDVIIAPCPFICQCPHHRPFSCRGSR